MMDFIALLDLLRSLRKSVVDTTNGPVPASAAYLEEQLMVESDPGARYKLHQYLAAEFDLAKMFDRSVDVMLRREREFDDIGSKIALSQQYAWTDGPLALAKAKEAMAQSLECGDLINESFENLIRTSLRFDMMNEARSALEAYDRATLNLERCDAQLELDWIDEALAKGIEPSLLRSLGGKL